MFSRFTLSRPSTAPLRGWWFLCVSAHLLETGGSLGQLFVFSLAAPVFVVVRKGGSPPGYYHYYYSRAG